MIQAGCAVAQLARLPRSSLVDALETMKAGHPHSEYVEYISRRALHAQDPTLILPPIHQTLPSLFFGPPEGGRDPEHRLSWWREDPGIATHHFNWHIYYPYTEPPRDRQGELFAYMHQQMLARYDFERLALDMGRVTAYGPGYGWNSPLKEGCNIRIPGKSFRPANMPLAHLYRFGWCSVTLVDVLSRHKDMLFYSVARGILEGPEGNIPVSMDHLGNTVEANMGSANKKIYGNLHNQGHNIIASMNDPEGEYGIEKGPMISTATAPKDPVFYRWHKFIDAIFETFRYNQVPYEVEDLEMAGISLESVSLNCHGNKVGGDNALITFMKEQHYVTYPGNPEQPVTVTKEILDHVPFRYTIKVRNTGAEPALLVFRIFLASCVGLEGGSLEEVRNTFVEMDKFVDLVPPGILEVSRESTDSSVILPEEITVDDIKSGRVSEEGVRCGCGWPRNLLLPRGTPGGMKAKVFVIATDWMVDGVNPDEALPGSVSYCGKTNAPYPDKRDMGFPFDRAIEFGSVEEMERKVRNCVTATVTISQRKHPQQRPSSPKDPQEVENSFVLVK
eukprot:sb/3463530/